MSSCLSHCKESDRIKVYFFKNSDLFELHESQHYDILNTQGLDPDIWYFEKMLRHVLKTGLQAAVVGGARALWLIDSEFLNEGQRQAVLPDSFQISF